VESENTNSEPIVVDGSVVERTNTLRLLKIAVQPVFVLDDGETLSEETPGQVVNVTPAQWDQFAAGFIDGVKRIIEEYAVQQANA